MPSIIFIKIKNKNNMVAPGGGRRGGVVNYNDDEMNHLFDVMESILPIGSEEWVKNHHRLQQPIEILNSRLAHLSIMYRQRI